MLTPPDDESAEVAPIMGYISLPAQQMAAKAVVMPPEPALRQVGRTLATSPVPGYPGFTPEEVRVLAAYRCQHILGTGDLIWQALVSAAPEAWMYAIHESAEIEALATAEVDILQRAAWERHMPQAHITACIVEDRFLKAWANHLGYNTTEMALEINNPIRKQFASHNPQIVAVQQSTAWTWPDTSQELDAIAFYQRILS